jgi:hypothetical protein
VSRWERRQKTLHRCCDKSRTSYPHWPPTSHREAIDQLLCLLGRSYPHREYLAHCWVAFLYRQLAPAVEGTKCHRDRMNILTLVRKSCPTLVASDRPSPRPKRQRMDCENICEPAIENNLPTCLCCCGIHREECPAHQILVVGRKGESSPAWSATARRRQLMPKKGRKIL